MRSSTRRTIAAAALAFLALGMPFGRADAEEPELDRTLAALLDQHRFTGRVQEQLEQRLGRKLDPDRADLGRFLFFDRLLGVKLDNAP